MHITVLGTGYEGLVISVGLAALGHRVTAVDAVPERTRHLQRARIPGDNHSNLSKYMKPALREGRLSFTYEPENALASSDAVIITGTLGQDRENAPTRAAVMRTAECLSGNIASFSVVIVTAAVPIGTCRCLQSWLDDVLHTGQTHVMACPVSIKEGTSFRNLFAADRIILGYEAEQSRRAADTLIAGIPGRIPPISHVTWEAAEMVRTPESVLAPSMPLRPDADAKEEIPAASGEEQKVPVL